MIDPVIEDLNRHEAMEAQQVQDEGRALYGDIEQWETVEILKDAIDGSLGEDITTLYNNTDWASFKQNYSISERTDLLRCCRKLEKQAELGRRIAKEIDLYRLISYQRGE